MHRRCHVPRETDQQFLLSHSDFCRRESLFGWRRRGGKCQSFSLTCRSRGVRNWRKRPALVRRGCIPTHRVNALWCRNEPVYTRHVVHKQQGIACEYFTGYTRSMAKRKVSKTPEIRDIPVVILCGGRGTRLKEETEFIPKPMVRIGDRPILWH